MDISYTSRVVADFVPNFVAMATGFGRGRIFWRHSIARTRKPPVIRKDLGDIFYIGRVKANFAPNFIAMATWVGRGRICLASINSATPKTPCYTQKSPGYLLYKPSYSRFCPKFRCHGNRGWSHVVEFVWRHSIAQPRKPPVRCEHLADISIQILPQI